MPSWKPNCLKGVDQNDSIISSSQLSHNLLNNNNNNNSKSISISSPVPIATTPSIPSPLQSNNNNQGIFFYF